MWIKFNEDHKAYNTAFKKDERRKVSKSIRDALVGGGIAVDSTEPTAKKENGKKEN